MNPLPPHLSRALLAGLVATVPAAPGVAHAQANQTVTLVREQDADRYDPHRATARSAAEIIFMATDTLVGLDFDMKTATPALAKSWTVSPDGLTYTFTLHPHVKFCSGKPLTAHDVVATYQRWLDPATNGLERWRAGPVDSITAADNTTVVYRLKEPYNELLMQMANYIHGIINIDQVRELGADFGVKGLDGSGPYCFQSWTPRNEVVLTRHVGYDWGPTFYADPRPKVERIVWKIVPEESTRLTAIQSGQADLSYYLPHWAIEELSANPRLSVSRADPYYWTGFLGFKIDKPVVNDVAVRRALNLAVDRQALTESIFFGRAAPATSMLATATATAADGNDIFRHDPGEARRILEAAGWQLATDGWRYKDGQKLSFLHYGTSSYWKDVIEAIQGDLRKVGAELRVQLFDSTAVWGKLATQEFDSFTMSFGYMSTNNGLNSYFLSSSIPTPNRMNWNDPETDAWLAAADRALDPVAADAIASRTLSKLNRAAVWIPLYHESLHLTAGPRLKPMRAHGLYGSGTYKGLDIAFKAMQSMQ